MKSADDIACDILKRLSDVESIIKNGNRVFNVQKNNTSMFWYRGGYFTIQDLKEELDSYGKEKQMLCELLNFYETLTE